MKLENITKEIDDIITDFALEQYCRTYKVHLCSSNYQGLKTYVANKLEKEVLKLGNFADDEEKMRDFRELTKEQFLASYSYLTEEEYDNTMKIEMKWCYDDIARVIDRLDQIAIRLGYERDDERLDRIDECIDRLEDAMYVLMYGEE